MKTISELYCVMFGGGPASMFVAMLAGLAVMSYFMMLALNEGSANVSGAIKLLVIINALISLTSIVNAIFGFSTVMC